MDLLAITLNKPTGLWPTIIFGMESSLKNYALALIIVTILIKLVMVPFDFINKYSSKKSSRKQAEMKPELDKIQAKYGNDKTALNQKTMQLYKAHNYNITGTCIGMLVYLVFSMLVFWSLFGALNKISNYKIGDQFLQVRKEYFLAFDINVDELDDKTALEEYNLKIEGLTEEEVAEKKVIAESNANRKYQETKVSFLWIENIWLADSTVNPVMKYKEFTQKSGIAQSAITEAEYNMIMEPIKLEERSSNGFFILAILAAGINYLSMQMNNWISRRKARKQGIDPALMSNNGSSKLSAFLMPVIMGVFTLFYNAAFGLYIVAGAIIALLTGPLTTMFVDMLEVEAIKKEQYRNVAIYDRKRRK